MSINKKEIEYLAKLARIELSAGEKEKYVKDLSSILGYVEKLQKVPTAKLVKIQTEIDKDSHLREDEVVGISKEDQDQLLKQVPDKEKRLIKAKAVFE